ncbi:MAG: PQQ-dependent sugar dehydrogenase, partial [Planctomycetota bacterium]|nr:PQQ-dependent sugar dehydrogenase [Planctomycetota bacterium]
VLRINVNGDDFPADANKNYSIPPTNPFVGIAGEDEIFARGMRNPFRASFDSGTGVLWIGDVGGTLREEIDTLDPALHMAANFGWNCAEGTSCTTNANCTCGGTLRAPVYDYLHSVGLCITGGSVYRGCAMADFVGDYFFADYQNNKIFSGTVTASNGLTAVIERTAQFAGGNTSITSICEGGDGELYVTNHTAGTVRRLVQSPAPPDTNGDGIPDVCQCPSDIIENQIVDGADLGVLLSEWGPALPTTLSDIDGSGIVDGVDIGIMLSNWGPCP